MPAMESVLVSSHSCNFLECVVRGSCSADTRSHKQCVRLSAHHTSRSATKIKIKTTPVICNPAHTRSLLAICFPCCSGGTVIQVLYPGSPPSTQNHILLIPRRSYDNYIAVSSLMVNNTHSSSRDSISPVAAGGVPFCCGNMLLSTIQIGGGR